VPSASEQLHAPGPGRLKKTWEVIMPNFSVQVEETAGKLNQVGAPGKGSTVFSMVLTTLSLARCSLKQAMMFFFELLVGGLQHFTRRHRSRFFPLTRRSREERPRMDPVPRMRGGTIPELQRSRLPVLRS